MPSPHSAAWQASPGVVQVQPASTWQLSSQPSSAVVLPSSHVSVPAISPSPQATVDSQGLPGSKQTKSASSALQSAAQPSPDRLLPSSQTSPNVATCSSPPPHPLVSTSPPLPPLPPRGVSSPPTPMSGAVPPLVPCEPPRPPPVEAPEPRSVSEPGSSGIPEV